MRILYRNNVNGIGTWKIWSVDNTIFISHATTIGSSEIIHKEVVLNGLAGRSLSEQIQSRIKSRISRMMDKGYKDSIEEAKLSSTNQLNLLRPMLALSFDDCRTFSEDLVIQVKLDGHRCLITKHEGEIIAYSRQGKIIDSIDHILNPLKDRLPEGCTIDGELYIHGTPLQTLASWIKRKQPQTESLNYVAYDLISNDGYIDRHSELSEILSEVKTDQTGKIMILPYRQFTNTEDMFSELQTVRSNGYEGLMVRVKNRKYEAGKRSSSLLKVKQFQDAEFECIDIESSREGWGICVLTTPEGKIFKTSAPGSIIEKTNQLKEKHKYIGKMLTVEFAQLTNGNIPFHCTAIRWRKDV